jgi:hypothetical protein
MDVYLFTVANLSDFDYARACGDYSRKDTFLRVRLRRGYMYPVRAEH